MTTRPHRRVAVYLESVADPAPPSGIEIPNDEPFPTGIRRVMVSQIDRVIDALTITDNPDTSIHEARKAMKRIRSLLRLVREEIGNDVYRNENAVFRDVGRALAPPRDAFVLVQTLTSILTRHDSLLAAEAYSDTLGLLEVELTKARRAVVDDRQLMSDLTITLKAARSRFAKNPALDQAMADPFLRDDFAAIERGLRRVYHKGRKGMPTQDTRPSTEQLHRWRKEVKYLRYQLETLTPLWPEVVGSEASRLNDLGEMLGHDHDLAVLLATVRSNPRLCPTPSARAVLRALVNEERTEATSDALRLGASSYGEPTRGFVSRYKGYWRASRSSR